MKLSIRSSPRNPARYNVRAGGKIIFRGNREKLIAFLRSDAWRELIEDQSRPAQDETAEDADL